MEWISSVSRSSGLEDGGDVLKDAKVQDEYRTFIESKLQRYWSQYPTGSHLSGDSGDSQRNLQSNILILFRKLREGLMASKRVDDFALEVYETSLYVSVLFRAPAQTTSIVNQLNPHRRGIHDTRTLSESRDTTPAQDSSLTALAGLSLKGSPSLTFPRRGSQHYHPPQPEQAPHPSSASTARSTLRQERHKSALWSTVMSTALISFFHILAHSYPLQPPYHHTLRCFRQSQFDEGEEARDEIFKWLKSIAAAVASRNYVRLQILTRSEEVDGVCHRLHPLEEHGIESHLEMRRLALRCLVENLRTKVRETVWQVLTVSYRELDTTASADWLLRSLMINPGPGEGESQAPSVVCQSAERWLERRGEQETRRKEGSKNRWLLCRRRV
ncbi:hypothetical protein JB92DRAFT_3140199 [Gautieria morchelliformis]|nr:hypothetical protein JB92DRAFT_3140199 [Gautieria morchelliformis]